jgi:hypothetical protein
MMMDQTIPIKISSAEGSARLDSYGKSYQSQIERAYRTVAAYAWGTGLEIKQAKNLADIMLDLEHSNLNGCRGVSGLNSDGAPLQLCVTLTDKDPKFRLIADPASDAAVIATRIHRSKMALHRVLTRTETHTMAQPIFDLLSLLEPSDRQERDRFSHGLFWIGASADAPGVAVYADTSTRSQEEGWALVDRWIFTTTLGMRKGQKRMDALRSCCKVSSLGIEGVDSTHYRCKIYAYPTGELPTGIMGRVVPHLDSFASSSCFQTIMRDASLEPDDILLNIGMDPLLQSVVDAKIDIRVSELGHSANLLSISVEECCHTLGLVSFPFSKMARHFDLAYSFVGFGADKNGRKRMNVYLKGRAE